MKLLRYRHAVIALTVTLAACSTPVSTPTEVSSVTSVTAPSATPVTTATAAPTVVASPTCKYVTSHGPNCSSRVILTYDDCPRTYGAFKTMVLAAEKLNIALMLFPTGNCLKAGLFSAKYARAHGHYVFNHSISHPLLTRLSYKAVLKQLGTPGVVTNYGRPPFGGYNPMVRKAYTAKHMRIWTWDVDTNDWRGKSQNTVVNYVITHAHKGQTVLMHMQWHGFNPTALKQIKAGLAKRGLKTCRNQGATPVVLSGSLHC